MSSGPIIALMIAKDKAISYWRELIGPTNTIKARQTHPDRQAMHFYKYSTFSLVGREREESGDVQRI